MAVLLLGAAALASQIAAGGEFEVEFRDIPNGADSMYHVQMLVTVVGHEKKYNPGIGCGVTDGVGTAGAKLAEFLAFSIASDDENWVVEQDGAKLLVRGWKNPKTGRVHPVAVVKFYTLPIKGAMPAELIPAVARRQQKA